MHCQNILATEIIDGSLPSPATYNAVMMMGSVDLYNHSLPNTFPVIFDSGASLTISPDKKYFAGKFDMYN